MSSSSSPVQIMAWGGSLLVLEGGACGIYASWDSLDVWVQAIMLATPPLLLWVGYAYARLRGGEKLAHTLQHVSGALASISWLAAVLILHLCVCPMPLPLLGLLVLVGAALPPLVRPAVGSFIAAGVAGIGAFVLQAMHYVLSPEPFPWVMQWGLLLTLSALWAQVGVWCRLTARPGYSRYSVIAPVALGFFLVLWTLGLIAAQYLQRIGAVDMPGRSEGLLIASLFWLLPVALLFLLHARLARRAGLAVCSLPAFCFLGGQLLAVPLGCLAMAYEWSFLIFLIITAYGVAHIFYGRFYHLHALMLSGCAVCFTLTACLLCLLSTLACAILFSLLGLTLIFCAVRFYRF